MRAQVLGAVSNQAVQGIGQVGPGFFWVEPVDVGMLGTGAWLGCSVRCERRGWGPCAGPPLWLMLEGHRLP